MVEMGGTIRPAPSKGKIWPLDFPAVIDHLESSDLQDSIAVDSNPTMANYTCIDIGTLRPEDGLDALSMVEAVAKPNTNEGTSEQEAATALPSPSRQSPRPPLEAQLDCFEVLEFLREKSSKHLYAELFVQFRQLEETNLSYLETELNSFEAALKSNAKGGNLSNPRMERLGNLLDRYGIVPHPFQLQI